MTLDLLNARERSAAAPALRLMARALAWVAARQGDRLGVEGSWSGNDTVWRMCLDLNRIVTYGAADGSLGSEPRRRVLHVVDAIVAGHGDGPLNARPLPLNLLLAATNAAAVDLVGAWLLGYDPAKIPIVAHAFDDFRWPVAAFGAGAVELVGDLGDGPAGTVLPTAPMAGPMSWPLGWLDAVRAGIDATGVVCADGVVEG